MCALRNPVVSSRSNGGGLPCVRIAPAAVNCQPLTANAGNNNNNNNCTRDRPSAEHQQQQQQHNHHQQQQQQHNHQHRRHHHHHHYYSYYYSSPYQQEQHQHHHHHHHPPPPTLAPNRQHNHSSQHQQQQQQQQHHHHQHQQRQHRHQSSVNSSSCSDSNQLLVEANISCCGSSSSRSVGGGSSGGGATITAAAASQSGVGGPSAGDPHRLLAMSVVRCRAVDMEPPGPPQGQGPPEGRAPNPLAPAAVADAAASTDAPAASANAPAAAAAAAAACQQCGGFYATRSSFSPVCLACHSFLYPLLVVGGCEVARDAWREQRRRRGVADGGAAAAKSDSEDSGTEEPQDFYETLRPPPTKKLLKPALAADARPNTEELNDVLQALSRGRPPGDRLQDGVVDSLPEEVLLAIFSYLDDVALWSASHVCERWRDILERHLSEARWRQLTLKRWPLLDVSSSFSSSFPSSPLLSSSSSSVAAMRGQLASAKPPCGVVATAASGSSRSWRQLYSNLVLSSNCLLCLSQSSDRLTYARAHYNLHQRVTTTTTTTTQPSSSSRLTTMAAGYVGGGGGGGGGLGAAGTVSGLRNADVSYICRDSRIGHEMAQLAADPLDEVQLTPVDHVMYGEWHACIAGPAGSPYEGGRFYLTVSVSCRYPMDPPVVRFLTKIFHPNVSQHGDIGLDSLQHNWSLALTLPKILLSIQSLLTDPYTRVCMEPKIGQMYRDNYALYEQTARLWTMLYAKHHLPPPPPSPTASSSLSSSS